MSNIPRMTRMNSIQMYVLTQLTLLIDQHLLNVVPDDVIYRIVWEVALLKDITMINCQHQLHHCIVATLKDEIYHDLLVPYLYTRNVKIPGWMLPRDLLDRLVQNDPRNVKLLITIYRSLANLGEESPYFQEILSYLEDCFGSDEGESGG
ncbi:hypothetical protein LI410_mgp041 (mitochondrion) [Apium graveolens]|uniref:hypothetical protein n=1 Tax=Apium graveolens TaxID=4045 RepID=UPI001D015D57|nr:hypothetical protein LI410_mgp041 [Apium graveolens]QVJ97942.1 hypothetical protein [Apium graveolens]